MRVLVCGGRDYADQPKVFDELARLHADKPITLLIEGGARGADFLAAQWAHLNGVPRESYPADWSKGRAAGPIRNKRMLDEGKPDLVVAFPGGRGTANMIEQARRANVRILHFGTMELAPPDDRPNEPA